MSDPSPGPHADQRTAAVVAHNVIGVYPVPSTDGPLSSQLRFGSRVTIVDVAVDADDGVTALARVLGEDRYDGWVRRRFLAAPEDVSDNPSTTIASLFADVQEGPSAESRLVTKLTVATRVSLARHAADADYVRIVMPGGANAYIHRAHLSSTYRSDAPAEIGALPGRALLETLRAQVMPRLLELAADSSLRLLGTPYLWGGVTPFGIDCSGLTQLCYRVAGIGLLRDASMQIADRRFVDADVPAGAMDSADFRPADLLFFRGRRGPARERVAHVGLALGTGEFVHAAGGGRGVIVTACEETEWAELFVGARRLSADADLAIEAA